MAGTRGIRIGIAVGARSAVAVVLGRRGALTARVELGSEGGSTDVLPDIQRAVGELKGGLERAEGRDTSGAEVYVALLPPLADVRLVPFPPMRRSEVEVVLARDVGRYFLGAERPRLVGAELPTGSGKSGASGDRAPMSVLAVAAPSSLVETLRGALEEVGWTAVSFAAAQGAWVDLVRKAGGSKGEAATAVVAVVDDTAHVLRLRGTDVVGVRQVSARRPDDLGDAVGEGPGRVLVLAPPEMLESFQGALGRKGWIVAADPGGWRSAEEASAARATEKRLELVPSSLARERRERTWRRVRVLAAASVALLLGAAGAHLWGAHRELGALQARRAQIRSQVAPLIAERDSLSELTARARSMEELSEDAPMWTRSLVELSALLPEDSYMTSFYASGDTVEIEAAGARAGAAIQALKAAGLFEEVRLEGPVERELQEGETVVERFRLWARLPGGSGKEGTR